MIDSKLTFIVTLSGHDDPLEDLVYDSVQDTLYLTCRNKNAIYKMDLSTSPAQLDEIDIGTDKTPSGITIDTCTRYCLRH